MKGFLVSLFTDENGVVSSKRMAGLLCVIVLLVALMGNIFYPKEITPSTHLIDAVSLLAFGCLGLTSLDKFVRSRGSANKSE
jgi:hypothetical protein